LLAEADLHKRAELNQSGAARVTLGVLAFLANVLAAAFVPTLLEGPISTGVKLFTHSPASMVIRAWICGIFLAGLTGAGMVRLWRTTTAAWVWTVGLLWFLFGLAGGLGYQVQNPWLAFSGIACAEARGVPCIQFWSFTVLFVRCVSYSAAAFTVARASADKPTQFQSRLSFLLRGLFLIGLPTPGRNEDVGEDSAQNRT
jgi:small-conductance mechanosensitive channel